MGSKRQSARMLIFICLKIAKMWMSHAFHIKCLLFCLYSSHDLKPALFKIAKICCLEAYVLNVCPNYNWVYSSINIDHESIHKHLKFSMVQSNRG